MTLRRLVFATVLLVCGFTAGLVLTGRMPSSTETIARPAAPASDAQPAAQSSGAASAVAVGSLPDFSRVASQTVPAVTNISSLQIVRRSN